jgi:hypothetical protein
LTVAPPVDVASLVIDEGTEIVGGVVSCTFTVNDALELFPCVSLAPQFTVVVAIEKVDPDAGKQETPTEPETVSLAVGAVKLTLAPEADVASLVMFPGTPLITGATVSTTVILNVAELVLPGVSFAVQVTVCSPIENVEPESGLQSELATPLESLKETE